MTDYKYRIDGQVGPWRLIKGLGIGGNGEVWEAARADEPSIALKILTRGGEAYPRFAAEVKIASHVGAIAGLVPVLEYSLPARPSKSDPAWLAMSIAKSLRSALGEDADLDVVLPAVAGIARTLAALHGRGIAHRDIKPGNLYWYLDAAAIGDFGLCSYPDKTAQTAPGKKCGPLGFLAPEMFDAGNVGDACPADVYSLAKTLHVLIDGQNYPPQGPQRLDDEHVSLTRAINDPRARQVDYLLERATQNSPTARPTAENFAAELEAILTPRAIQPNPTDLSDLATRARIAFEPAQRQIVTRMRYHDTVRELHERGTTLLEPIAASLRTAGIAVTRSDAGYLRGASDGVEAYASDSGTSIVSEHREPAFESGVAVFIHHDDSVELIAGHVIWSSKMLTGRALVPLTRRREALGSAALIRAFEDLCGELATTTRPALEAFLEYANPDQKAAE